MKVIIALLTSILWFATTAEARCTAGNCRDGNGKAYFPNGDVYAGQWQRGLMHGRGVYTYKSGAEYQGEFERGKIEGKGTVRYPDGAYYTGSWRNNQKDGEGRLVTPSGKTLTGRWTAGKRVAAPAAAIAANRPAARPAAASESPVLRDCNVTYCVEGTGRYTYRDGAAYVGDFEEGQPSGEGTVRYANGDVYMGGWENNGPDGAGSYAFVSGQQVAGRWQAGKLVRRTYDEASPAKPTNSTKAADGRATMYAVVVGISAYNSMQSLRYTDDDAYQMYAFLKSPEGGALADDQVEVLVDERATRANIEQALTEKLAQADADDIVVFYYSGHGVDGYFVPVDFDGKNNLLSHRRVEQLLENSAAKHKLVLADACHSGGLLAARAGERSDLRLYEAFTATNGGTALLLSSRSEEVSLESNGLRSGVFSHYLMRGMRGEADADHDRIVTVSELHNFISERVINYTNRRQTPVLSGTFDARMPVASLR